MTKATRVRVGVHWLAILLFGCALVGLGIQLSHNAMTSDEEVYAPVGLRYLIAGDVVMNAEHPPLTKLLAGAALLPARPITEFAFREAEQWPHGKVFWFESGNETDKLLLMSRLPFAVLTMVLLVWICRWMSARFGQVAGLASLAGLALNPVVIAHGTVATNDFFFGFAAWMVFVSSVTLVEERTDRSAAYWGISIACLALSKFSALILLPVSVFAVGLFLLRSKQPWQQTLRLALIACGVATTLIWGTYALIERKTVFAPDPITLSIQGQEISLRGAPLKQLAVPFIRYGQGLLNIQNHNEVGQLAYLNGEISQRGFPTYFLWAFWYKTPTIILIGLLTGLVAGLMRRQAILSWLSLAGLLFFAVASVGQIHIGIRYALVLYVLLAPGLGYAVAMLAERLQAKAKGLVLVGLLLALGLDVLNGGGLSIGYFSSLSGGQAQGYQHLADSNSDWGQDLTDVSRFVAMNQIERPVYAHITGENPAVRRFQYRSIEELSCAELESADWIIVSTSTLVGLHGSYPCLLERAQVPTTIRISQSYWAFRGHDLASGSVRP